MPVDIDSYPAILIMVLGFPFLGGIFSFSDPFSDLLKVKPKLEIVSIELQQRIPYKS
jgi:hypothetical protein